MRGSTPRCFVCASGIVLLRKKGRIVRWHGSMLSSVSVAVWCATKQGFSKHGERQSPSDRHRPTLVFFATLRTGRLFAQQRAVYAILAYYHAEVLQKQATHATCCHKSERANVWAMLCGRQASEVRERWDCSHLDRSALVKSGGLNYGATKSKWVGDTNCMQQGRGVTIEVSCPSPRPLRTCCTSPCSFNGRPLYNHLSLSFLDTKASPSIAPTLVRLMQSLDFVVRHFLLSLMLLLRCVAIQPSLSFFLKFAKSQPASRCNELPFSLSDGALAIRHHASAPSTHTKGFHPRSLPLF